MSDWTSVPNIGTYVEADHPITVANPMKAFRVLEVRGETSGKWYARGQNTMWFHVGMLKPADIANAIAAEDADQRT